ncbi:helix-turn-helix domain-containing protein [Micromonospora sp. WMMD1102]|uniref:helix-turn-helix domain-containing protein n=1 Tax=Micromonospora sp. WMMD1102 TaxID=3016105 RepID=UPI00241541EC|nr:helix-turn-helix domain-containing protein [Micromonospora sp. WMMD1102]MDG4791970.1 helix-turn-helix domain-containing protein [Micromonospora sp. WMMD1102]
MLAITDLHPDDTAARDRIAAQLHGIRVAAGVSQRALAARLHVTQRRVAVLEHNRSWEARTVQGWARAFGHRLTLTIVGLVVPDDGDALAAVYDQQHPASPAEEDQLALRRVVNDLARIRRRRMSAHRFGQILGRCESSILQREDNPDGTRLATVQQTARALGGRLDVGLAPVGVSCAAV